MTDRQQVPPAAPTERRTRIGVVPLAADRLLVDVVQRSWTTTTARPNRDPGSEIRTVAPAGVEVRREPDTGRAEPGGMTPDAARALARLMVKAAGRAEALGAAPADKRRAG